MTLRKFRCAVVGCGWIGARVADDPLADGIQSHAQAYSVHPETLLVGLTDVDAAALAWALKKWPETRGYSNLDVLLKTEMPEIVSVCTPDHTHHSICKELLKYQTLKAIILEKPIATDFDLAKEIVREAERKKILIVVNYTRRFAESHQKIKQRIANGELGEIVSFSGVYSKGVIHNGSHWFDLVSWLMGDIVGVEAWNNQTHSTDDPTCHVKVELKSGIQGFLIGIDASKFSIFELDIIGSLGRMRLRDSGQQIEYTWLEKSNYYSGYTCLGTAIFEKGGFKDVALNLVTNTIQSLTSHMAPLCSGEDGLNALRVAIAARRSYLEYKQIRINI